VYENRALRRIFGRKRVEVKMERRELHDEELIDMYFSTNMFRVIKKRRIRWAGHEAPMRRGYIYIYIYYTGF